MNHIWVISDTHLGHHNIIKYQENRKFNNIYEHDDYIIERIKEKVGKKDTLIHLGDVAFQRDKIAMFKEIKCLRKILIMGNHDTFPMELYLDTFDRVYGCFEKKGYIFTHIPVHPGQLISRYKGNIHGHLHHKDFLTPWHHNVCMDVMHDWPKKLMEIIT